MLDYHRKMNFGECVFMTTDNTQKFSGIAREYTQSRPGYAQALLDCLFENYGFSASSVVADVGSGTGKFAKQLLEKGCFVFGVEPNADMRGIAENELCRFDNFKSVDGTAEHTTLPDGSVDFVTVAQAFHWFDGVRFKEECLRILKPDGVVCLIWNTRKEDADINCQLYKIYEKYCPDFKGFHGGIKTHDERIRSFFDDNYEYLTFENPLYSDRDKFIKRSLSSSFSLKKGDRDFDSYIAELNALFDRFEVDGIAQVANQTVLYVGKIQK
ncbi:MAG: class I SAM-dependent methyltransferase [Ruminococcaceae bacterium]|nr:class I SAM-dependent methyltransferase [Oscillospiraceae bacterium]